MTDGVCNLGQFAGFSCKKIRQTVQSDKHWWKKIRQTPKTIRQTVSNSSDNLTNMFTVCRIFFCVCRIVLLARLSFDGLAQKSWQKPKNLINFHKNDFWAKSSWQNRENGISKLLSGRFYYRFIFLGAKLK